MAMATKEIKICISHKDRPTPMIWTFAFTGAEYWCPFCGYSGGMFGTGDTAPATPDLIATAEADKEKSREFVAAMSAQNCSRLQWKGKLIPPSELPIEEKQRIAAVIAAWRYPMQDRA